MVAAFSVLQAKPVVGALVPAVGRAGAAAGAAEVVAQEKLLILLHAVSLLKLLKMMMAPMTDYAQAQRKRGSQLQLAAHPYSGRLPGLAV